MTYELNEKMAYEWFCKNYDAEAILAGGYDSTISDIYSPKFGCYVEVKMMNSTTSTRCGQFTESTINNNPFSILLYNGIDLENNLRNFVEYHYTAKQVGYFIVGIGETEYTLLSMEEFLKVGKFSFPKPYKKRSGTNHCPKKYQEKLLQDHPEFTIKDGYVYCVDPTKWKTYLFSEGIEFFISDKTGGEVRKCSTTNNLTYHIEVKM
jgi:hypothetical protein